ncbi:MAG: sugar ABC transporter substrate-binding protein [Spirochaetes bacterium]|nr:sugar ABC transporter substrate-binding protein [Spirochaetota bacterium]
MKLQKNFLLVFSFFMLVFLFSCGKAKQKGVPIRLAFWGSAEEIDVIKQTVEPWDKERDDLYVLLEHVPVSGNVTPYVSKILTQIAGNNAPDVIFMEVNIFVNFYFRDVLLPLNDFLKNDEEFNINDFYPDVVKRFTREDQIYVIPRDTAPFNCVFYNKDLFDKEGIPYPKDNWTWNDLVRIGKQLTKENEQGVKIQYGFWTWVMMNFLYSAGGGYVDNVNDPTRCVLDSAGSKEALRFFHDLMWKYGISPQPGATDISMGELFETGQLAMFGSGIWESPRFRKIKSFDWDIVSFPRHPKKGLQLSTGGSGYAIAKSSKHHDKAWELIKCLAGDRGQSILGDTGLAQPAKIKIAASKHFAYDGQKPKNKAILLKSVQNVVYDPFIAGWTEIHSKYIQPELELFYHNKKTYDQILKKIIPSVNQAIKDQKVQ